MYHTDYKQLLDEDGCVEIYKGDYFNSNKSRNCKKVIVFDLDETLGSFVDLDILWNTIQFVCNKDNPISHYDLFDLYPEFLRPNIINILKYIYKRKKKGECYKLYIYTNNQSQTYSVNQITEYLNRKITKTDILFDQIIYAFKINNRIVQVGRTTHNKTYNDLINCTLLPKKTAICFLDDVEFDEMKKERIYYIQPQAYRHNLTTNEILKRLFNSKYACFLNIHKDNIVNHFITRSIKFNTYNETSVNSKYYYDLQNKVSKKIMYHLRDFFLLTKKNNKTKKKKPSSFNFTRKNI